MFTFGSWNSAVTCGCRPTNNARHRQSTRYVVLISRRGKRHLQSMACIRLRRIYHIYRASIVVVADLNSCHQNRNGVLHHVEEGKITFSVELLTSMSAYRIPHSGWCYNAIISEILQSWMVAVIKTRSTGTVHTSAKARLTSVAIRIRIWTGSPPKSNRLFIGPLPTFPENFMQIRSEFFCAKLLTDKQTDKQTTMKT